MSPRSHQFWLAFFAAALGAPVALASLQGALAKGPPEVRNLGLASGREPTLRVAGDLVIFPVHEQEQGGIDRNGDGDAVDSIVHVYDASRDTVFDLGLAVPGERTWAEANGRLVAFVVDERAQGADLNNDGDSDDWVVHVLGPTRGSTGKSKIPRNLKLAFEQSSFGFYAVFLKSRIAFGVSEPDQGTDLNGDGDSEDVVLHVFEGRSGEVFNTRLAVVFDQFKGDGAFVAFGVDEAAQGESDLNGDGDALDVVLHVLHAPSATLHNLAFALGSCALRGRLLAFSVPEADQAGRDLNRDGDALDCVLHVASLRTGRTTNVGVAVNPFLAFDDSSALLVTAVREADQAGVDLNGDADAEDDVLHVLDLVRRRIDNVGLAATNGRFVSALPAPGRLGRSPVLSFSVVEAAQGGVDRNGDGDSDDLVLHLYDTRTRVTKNLALAVIAYGDYFGSVVSGSLLAIRVPEAWQRADLNGDGDLWDLVPRLYDVADGSTIEPGFATYLDGNLITAPIQLAGHTMAFLASESRQGGTDLNGDGDNRDDLLFLLDVRDGSVEELDLSIRPRADGPSVLPRDGNLMACTVGERQGGVDLNGDGDQDDFVVQVIDLRP